MTSLAKRISTQTLTLELLQRLHFCVGLCVSLLFIAAIIIGANSLFQPDYYAGTSTFAHTVTKGTASPPLGQVLPIIRRHIGEKAIIIAMRTANYPHPFLHVDYIDNQPSTAEPHRLSANLLPSAIHHQEEMRFQFQPLIPNTDRFNHPSFLYSHRVICEMFFSLLWFFVMGSFALKSIRRDLTHTNTQTLGRNKTALSLMSKSTASIVFTMLCGAALLHFFFSSNAPQTTISFLLPAQVNRLLTANAYSSMHHAYLEHEILCDTPSKVVATALPAQRDAQWQQLFAIAQAAGFSNNIEVRQPASRQGVWTVIETEHYWPSVVRLLSVDPVTLAIIERTSFHNFPLIFDLNLWGIYDALGILFGAKTKLIFTLSGLLSIIMASSAVLVQCRKLACCPGNSGISLARQLWSCLPLSTRILGVIFAAISMYILPLATLTILLCFIVDGGLCLNGRWRERYAK